MKLAIATAFLLVMIQAGFCQYSVDWGKYMNDTLPDADFSSAEQSEQLMVDVKKASANLEYVYVTGRTHSRSDEEVSCAENELYYGAEDDFLAKYDKCGNLQWFRYLGTDNNNEKDECGDFADCLAIDKDPLTDSTYIYVGGYSFTDYEPKGCSTCLPCGPGNSAKAFSCNGDTCVFQKSKKSEIDAFIAKYDENGNLLKWTYFGGTGDDYIIGMSIYHHDIFITGTTSSNPDFLPETTPMFDSTLSANLDAFVAQMDAGLCTLKFFSYMGGPKYERSHAIRCFKTPGSPSQTQFYISGATEGDMADTAYHPLNGYHGGSNDSFLALWKLNKQTGVFSPQWMQYIGGKADDRDREMITDKANNAIMTGFTQSNNFFDATTWSYPKANFFDTTFNGVKDAFVAKYDVSGAAIWGTYFGGSKSDASRGLTSYSIKTGTTLNYVAFSGGTQSVDMPVQPLQPPFQEQLNGGNSTTNRDAFVAILTDPKSSGEKQQLEFASYFGGTQNEWDDATVDYGPDIEMGGNKEIYLTFYTRSTDIEDCITGVDYHYNSNSGADQDGFLAKILNNAVPKRFDCLDFNWGIEDPEKHISSTPHAQSLHVYPNPSDGNFRLYLETQDTVCNYATIEILDVLGKLVCKTDAAVTGGKLNTYLSVSRLLAKGVYVLKVTMSSSACVEQLVCQ